MNKQGHLMMWDQMRMRHGITLRVIDQIPADKLASHPIAGMRTPVELLVHMYASMVAFTDSVLKGSVAPYDEKDTVASIKTREQLVAFVTKSWVAADKDAHAVTDAQLGSMVKTPWGDSFPGFAMYGIIADEYLHHRGQLYAYIRTYGIEPVMVWDFEHNAAEFQPREHAKS
jgi:uncharacterized damage-inducible protein DinB